MHLPDRDTPPAPALGEAEPESSRHGVDAIARMVAHAINNPLAALVLDVDMARELLEPDASGKLADRVEDARRLLHEARKACDRVTTIVSNLQGAATASEALKVLSAGSPEPARKRPSTAPRGRVLVIDDDALVGSSVRRSLRAFDVTVLSSARVALKRIEGGERWGVILCDLMMPELTGMDLHDALMLSVPDQAERMVFFTGGAVTTRARDFVETTRRVVIAKPVDVQRLRELVRERLG